MPWSPWNPYLLMVHSLTYGMQLWAILHIAKDKYAMSYIYLTVTYRSQWEALYVSKHSE